jgi:hypothetical protein
VEKKFGPMGVAEVRRLMQLDYENTKLDRVAVNPV